MPEVTLRKTMLTGLGVLAFTGCTSPLPDAPCASAGQAAVPRAIPVTGDVSDWPNVYERQSLVTETGEQSRITVSLAYVPEESTLLVHVESQAALQRTELFVDVSNDFILDRPVQYTYTTELVAAQGRHDGAAKVSSSSSPSGHAQQWQVDLRALGLTADPGEPVAIGFDLELVDEAGRLHQWGGKSDKWLVDRRLRRLILAPAGTAFGQARGQAGWSEAGAGSPPQRVVFERANGSYRQWFDVDPVSREFCAELPEGTYRVRAWDTRTSPRLADVERVEVAANRSTDLGRLAIRRPTNMPLDELVPQLMDAHNIRALSVSYVKDGRVEFERAFGVFADGDPVDESAVFKMASVAKPVAAMVALALVSKGEWSLDMPLARYWVDPDIADDPRHELITTRMVLTHTSGLPNHRSADGLAFLFDPGKRQSYSGEGLEYLRRALEARYDAAFQNLADEHVFSVAGMTRSSFQGPRTDAERYVDKFHNEYRFDPPGWVPANVKGGLLTTPADLSRFLLWVLDGAGLPNALWAEITTQNNPVLLEDPDLDFRRYGLGWVVSDNGQPVLSHGGSEFGARTFMIVLPQEKSAIAIAANATGGGPAIRAILEATIMSDRRLSAIDSALEHAESFEW